MLSRSQQPMQFVDTTTGEAACRYCGAVRIITKQLRNGGKLAYPSNSFRCQSQDCIGRVRQHYRNMPWNQGTT